MKFEDGPDLSSLMDKILNPEGMEYTQALDAKVAAYKHKECPYCHNNSGDEFKYLVYDAIWVDDCCSTLVVELDNTVIEIPISYCPICGRDLNYE